MSDGVGDTVDTSKEDLPQQFSLVVGGAFHALLGRMGLLKEDMLPGRSAAIGLAIAAFLIPALFAVLQSFLDARYSGWDYFQDATVYARYLIAILAMISTERLAHGHHLEFHSKWVEGRVPGKDILGSADPSSVSDLNASVQTVNEMRTFPVDRSAVIQLLASAAAPFLAVAALQMPFGSLVKLILGVLL